MFNGSDSKIDMALKIIKYEFNVNPIDIKRFPNGYCHSVYYIKLDKDEFVLRVTDNENKNFYTGSIKWLSELIKFGLPVPKIIKHGQYNDVFYTILSLIQGKDLGEIYHTLNDLQKYNIVNELNEIQRKTASLPNNGLYGYPYSEGNQSFKTWVEYLESLINRSIRRIKNNNIFNVDICDKVKETMYMFNEYFRNIQPIAFLDDTTTKNVLIHDGKLSGIVDIDEICFGDMLLVVGLTNMALLSMKMDTKYTDYWLEVIKADKIQRKVVIFYTLLFCIDFMGEQGMTFNNDNIVKYNKDKVELLNEIYNDIIKKLYDV